MHGDFLEDLKEAVIDYNESFLAIKEINRDFHKLIIDSNIDENELKEHAKSTKLLLDEVRSLKAELPNGGEERSRISFYDIPSIDEHFGTCFPPSEIEGYFLDSVRRYFLSALRISHSKGPFKGEYFDFCLDGYFEDPSLSESLEIQHTVDWALIGKSLAKKEIAKITKKKGRSKTDSEIDYKRSSFADGVISCFIEIQLEKPLDDFECPTDLEICQMYRSILDTRKSELCEKFDDLEAHIRLKSISDRAACNSISRGRNI